MTDDYWDATKEKAPWDDLDNWAWNRATMVWERKKAKSMTRHEAILKITDYLREHRVDPKTPVEAAFDGDSPMRGALLMLEALGLVQFEPSSVHQPAINVVTGEPSRPISFNVRSSLRPIPVPDQTALEALETMHKIADLLLAELILAKGSRGQWFPSRQPWWPEFERAVKTMKRLEADHGRPL